MCAFLEQEFSVTLARCLRGNFHCSLVYVSNTDTECLVIPEVQALVTGASNKLSELLSE